MATHVEYTERIANSKGEYPVEARNMILGVEGTASPIVIQVGENPAAPGNSLVRIDSALTPEQFSNAMMAILMAMAGELEDGTAERREIVQPEPAGTEQADPSGEDPPLDGEIAEHPED